MKTSPFESPKPLLHHVVNSKQLTSTAPTVQWTLSFCIALCFVELFALVVLGERGPLLELDDVVELRKCLHDRKLRSLDTPRNLT